VGFIGKEDSVVRPTLLFISKNCPLNARLGINLRALAERSGRKGVMKGWIRYPNIILRRRNIELSFW
jgi:hypothetical protein